MRMTTIQNVELSSICNRACPYCPSPEIPKHRPAILMSDTHLEAAAEWIRCLVKQGTQREVNLFGVGESTLHPRLADFTAMVRAVHPAGHLRLNTNGHLMTVALARDLKAAGITDVHVTDHDAAVTMRAVEALEEAHVHHAINRDFVNGPNNWAGQVAWTKEIKYRLYCAWLGTGQVMAMADGRVTRCCLDAFGAGVFGRLEDHDLDERELGPFSLCRSCHHYLDD